MQLYFLQSFRDKFFKSIPQLLFRNRRAFGPNERSQTDATTEFAACLSTYPHANYAKRFDDYSNFDTDGAHNFLRDDICDFSSDRRIIAHRRGGKFRQLLLRLLLGVLDLLRDFCQPSTASGGITLCKE